MAGMTGDLAQLNTLLANFVHTTTRITRLTTLLCSLVLDHPVTVSGGGTPSPLIRLTLC